MEEEAGKDIFTKFHVGMMECLREQGFVVLIIPPEKLNGADPVALESLLKDHSEELIRKLNAAKED